MRRSLQRSWEGMAGMRTFFRLLVIGWIALSVVVVMAFLAALGYGLWAYSRIGSNPEVSGAFAYEVTDEQGLTRERLLFFPTDDEWLSKEDFQSILSQGEFRGHLELYAGADFRLVALDMEFAAPVQEILDAFSSVLLREVVGDVIVQEVFGEEESSKTIQQLLEEPPAQLLDLLGKETYEKVLVDLSQGNLAQTLEEVITGEDLEETLEKLPKETVEEVAEVVLGEAADMTMPEIVETTSEELEEVLGEEYKEVIFNLFAGDETKTLKDIVVEDPAKVFREIKEALRDRINEELLGGGS